MGARQHADADRNRPHGARVASVDARLAVEYAAAYDARLEFVEQPLGQIGARGVGAGRHQFRHCPAADLIDALVARLLLANAVGLAQRCFGNRGELLDQLRILRLRFPVPRVLARFIRQFTDGADRGLHLLMAEHHRAEHDILRQFPGLGFDHQNGVLGTGNDQIELRQLQFGRGRIEHVLVIDPGDSRRADRAVERDAR